MAAVTALRSKTPDGGTPMLPAVQGALRHLANHLSKNPGHKAALVLSTDGLPSPCSTTGQDDITEMVGAVSMAGKATPSIPTYVVGVYASGEIAKAQPELDRVATAGGSGRA
ncbi:MAG TPA: hypothetical protein VGF45_04750, partial [Polyangia bacterium]